MDSGSFLSNAWYDRLKFVALVVVPALGALYFGLAQIWGLPKAEEVVGTVTVVNTFLGLLLKTSERQYDKSDAKYDGVVTLEQGADGQEHLFLAQEQGKQKVLNLDEKKELYFKVKV